MTQKNDNIALIGAGLAGALLAVLLARRGFRVTLYEKRPDMRKQAIPAGRSINLALASRGIQALQHAGLFGHVRDLLIPMPGRMIHDTGGKLTYQPYSKNPDEVNYSVSRGLLNMALLDAAEATGRVTIRFQQRCDDLDFAGDTLHLTDETGGRAYTVQAAPVIATDGAGSPVRQAMEKRLGIQSREELLAHGYKELAIPPGPGGEHRIEREALHIWPRGGYMLIALPNLDGSFTLTLFLPHEGDPGFASLRDEKSVRDFFTREFPDALALIPDLTRNFFANPTGHMGTVRCLPWHADGTALLLGDAAHAIVPFHGQGMNCAFEDCLALDALLERHGPVWSRVFAEFENLRKPNAEAIADMALENYIEMRDSVRDPKFHLRKKLEFFLEERHPNIFIPRYSMVMFHPGISYADAKSRGSIQNKILDMLSKDTTKIDDIDFELADRLINDMLSNKNG